MMSGRAVVIGVVVMGMALAGFARWFVASHRGESPALVPGQAERTNPAATKGSSETTREERGPRAERGSESTLARVVRSGPMARPRDFFRPILRPEFLSVDEAGDSMSDDEVVLGLEFAGEVRAYPTNYLNDHEMVREEIGGLPLLVTW